MGWERARRLEERKKEMQMFVSYRIVDVGTRSVTPRALSASYERNEGKERRKRVAWSKKCERMHKCWIRIDDADE